MTEANFSRTWKIAKASVDVGPGVVCAYPALAARSGCPRSDLCAVNWTDSEGSVLVHYVCVAHVEPTIRDLIEALDIRVGLCGRRPK